MYCYSISHHKSAMFSGRFLALLFLATTAVAFSHHHSEKDVVRKLYIVYMGSIPSHNHYSPVDHHMSILEEIRDKNSSYTLSSSLVHSYTKSFNGFAAKLSDAEKHNLISKHKNSIVSVFETRKVQLLTTRSWDFIGLTRDSLHNRSESDVTIGVIDTGIWPGSPSFSDAGFSSPPKKWKGVCDGGANFTCNNKLIGARYYTNTTVGVPRRNAFDLGGHGTHTASTAAGNFVDDASFFGLGSGLARGGVPSARVAAYRVCQLCDDSDILKAFDDAISDGVDIITVSMAYVSAADMFEDAYAIGSFHALSKNILTTQGAGNDGPLGGSVVSLAPWLFTVGASTTDRHFVSRVVLSNKKVFQGYAVNSFSLPGKEYPIIFGKNIGKKCDEHNARLCEPGCLDHAIVRGKIVVCNTTSGITEAFKAGAAGAIVNGLKLDDHSNVVPFPSTILSAQDFESTVEYYYSSKYPRAMILKSEGKTVGSPPEVASFSSRGPNLILPDILKPDITAPGVDILAAYSIYASVYSDFLEEDTTHAKFSVLSGTSMACPHVAGAAAYVKSFHPDWSPSAIKSAIMTTAWAMKNSKELDYGFANGAGQINPVKAVDPGLVYETTKEGYIKMLCGIGYDRARLRIISGDNSTCPKYSSKPDLSYARNLNYPTMTAYLKSSGGFEVRFTRTVTNVGDARSTYKSRVTSNNKATKVEVEPSALSFISGGEKISFNVTVTSSTDLDGIFYADLVWSDGGRHSVRSPIMLYNSGI